MSQHPSLQASSYFVRQQPGRHRPARHHNIFDPASGHQWLTCREPHLGVVGWVLRFDSLRWMTPFHIEICDMQGERLLSVRRGWSGWSLLTPRTEVRDAHGDVVGSFQKRLLSIGGTLDVLDASGLTVCTMRGKPMSWNYFFMEGYAELAAVSTTRRAPGGGLIFGEDNYLLNISPAVGADDPRRLLLLAAVMCIDMLLAG